MKDLLLVLPRVIAAHIQWLAKVWKYRCKLVHAADSQASSANSSFASDMLAEVGRITSFTKLTRGQGTHPDNPVEDMTQLSQITLDSFPSATDPSHPYVVGTQVGQRSLSYVEDEVQADSDTVSGWRSGDGVE